MTEISKSSVVTDCILSDDVVTLFNSSSVQNENDAITVILHALMLESEFIPKGISREDKYKSMPDAWNTNGIFRIKYEHSCCPSYICCMTCVPLYKTISVHGIISDVGCSESVSIVINVFKYVNKSKDFSNVFNVFCNLQDLSIYFKDNFCLPLLNLLHTTNGKSPLYGILGLFDELKMYILQMLPVEGVMSLAAVNKEFHHLANLPSLWKYLYIRDFSKGGVPDTDTTSSKTNWKQIYMREHLKTKRKYEPRHYVFPQSRLPEIFSVGPDYDMDIGIQSIFPHKTPTIVTFNPYFRFEPMDFTMQDFDPPFPGPSLFNPPSLRPRFPPLFRRLF